MTWCYEMHNGGLHLVHYASPTDTSCTLIAKFVSAEAAELFKEQFARALLMARAVERSGI